MSTNTAIRARRRRPLLERLEGRRLLNASIDIGPDGDLVYRLGADDGENVHVRRQGDVYMFQSSALAIDLDRNDAGLTVTGAGTFFVTVEQPSGLRIVTAAETQGVVIRSTGVPTAVDLQASRSAVFLGDDGTQGSGGLAALAAPISVVGAQGTGLNRLTISDGAFAYDPSGVLTYAVSATTVSAEGIDGFAGITYAGLDALRLSGTTNRTAPSALYLVTGTADGVDTTIDATGGFGRDFSIVGMSSDFTSTLTLLSAGEAHVWAGYIGSPTVFAGGSRSDIYIEGVRDATHGLGGSLVVDAAAGGVAVNIAPYWNAGVTGRDAVWTLVRGSWNPGGSESPFARLQGGGGSLFYRPEELDSLGIDDRGAARSMLEVDMAYGDPIPSGSPAWGRGLIYVASPGGSPYREYSLSIVNGSADEEYHVALPLYRGAIEFTTGGRKSYLSYQLSFSHSRIDDAAGADVYRWTTDFTSIAPGIRAYSYLLLGAYQSFDHRNSILMTDDNLGLRMVSTTIRGKRDVQILRGPVPGNTTTALDYFLATTAAITPSGMESLTIVNATPGGLDPQTVRLIRTLPGVAVTVAQGLSDVGRLSMLGMVTSKSVVLTGGGLAELDVDAAGVPLSASDLVSLCDGWTEIPRPTPLATNVRFKGYSTVRLRNTTAGGVVLFPAAEAATGAS